MDRYSRQVLVEGWDQPRVSAATVLVVGVGGLGCAAAAYLAAAGVGRLRLCDAGRVERSNLNRQLLYSTSSVGALKVEQARERLSALNAEVVVEAIADSAGEHNIGELARGCDVIVDGLDSDQGRLLLNQQAATSGVPYVYGAAQGWQGLVGVFAPPRTACLACLMRSAPPQQAPVAVVGAVPGLVGAAQATEALKVILDAGASLQGKLLVIDALRGAFEVLELDRRPGCPVCAPQAGGARTTPSGPCS